jgi:SAM-dependent methyltransferase
MDLPLTDIAKNATLALPPVRRYYRWRRGAVRCHESDDPGYPLGVFEKHRAAIEKIRPISGRVLEIGTGANLAVAALFVRCGADTVVSIDAENWLSAEARIYAELGLDDEVLSRVEYYPDCPIEDAAFADDSFEIAVSHACLEHVGAPAAAVRNVARMLVPGGVTTHEIDLRDHRDFAEPLRFLRHGDLVWDLATSRRAAMPNRWRLSDYEHAFAGAGLNIVDLVRVGTVNVTEADRRSFAARFRSRGLEDLETTTIFLTAVKRGAASDGGDEPPK